jgi:serine/threonine-protein kinase SRPK3
MLFILVRTFPLPSIVLLIHGTDLKPDNIMVKIEDLSILDIDARSEFQNPLPQKHYEDGRTIYLSRNNYGQPHTTTGIIRITDFDLAARGDVPHKGCIQAEVYRAPEVIINAGYTYSADIWSLGTMVIPQP